MKTYGWLVDAARRAGRTPKREFLIRQEQGAWNIYDRHAEKLLGGPYESNALAVSALYKMAVDL